VPRTTRGRASSIFVPPCSFGRPPGRAGLQRFPEREKPAAHDETQRWDEAVCGMRRVYEGRTGRFDLRSLCTRGHGHGVCEKNGQDPQWTNAVWRTRIQNTVADVSLMHRKTTRTSRDEEPWRATKAQRPLDVSNGREVEERFATGHLRLVYSINPLKGPPLEKDGERLGPTIDDFAVGIGRDIADRFIKSAWRGLFEVTQPRGSTAFYRVRGNFGTD